MSPVVKKVLKITASAVILLVVTVGGGVGYVWYAGEYGEDNSQAFAEAPVVAPVNPAPKRNQPAEDARVGISVQSVTSPVTPGSNASIMIRTNPQAMCTIDLEYDKVPAKDSGLVDRVADEYGMVQWTWTVDPNAALGAWPVKMTCANKKNSAYAENDLKVVRSIE